MIRITYMPTYTYDGAPIVGHGQACDVECTACGWSGPMRIDGRTVDCYGCEAWTILPDSEDAVMRSAYQ